MCGKCKPRECNTILPIREWPEVFLHYECTRFRWRGWHGSDDGAPCTTNMRTTHIKFRKANSPCFASNKSCCPNVCSQGQCHGSEAIRVREIVVPTIPRTAWVVRALPNNAQGRQYFTEAECQLFVRILSYWQWHFDVPSVAERKSMDKVVITRRLHHSTHALHTTIQSLRTIWENWWRF